MQQPVSKNVPALAVGGKLGFVKRDKGKVSANRHRLDRAQQIACVLRLDFFLASDQRYLAWPLDRADLVVDLARKQPQRKADRA